MSGQHCVCVYACARVCVCVCVCECVCVCVCVAYSNNSIVEVGLAVCTSGGHQHPRTILIIVSPHAKVTLMPCESEGEQIEVRLRAGKVQSAYIVLLHFVVIDTVSMLLVHQPTSAVN